jgi:DNA-binding transcriptional LysR family regulator
VDAALAASHTVRRLETRLGVRLLTRTTRRVAPTQAGERLLKTLGPALDTIAAELASLSELRDKPAGTIRITTSEHAQPSSLKSCRAARKSAVVNPSAKRS